MAKTVQLVPHRFEWIIWLLALLPPGLAIVTVRASSLETPGSLLYFLGQLTGIGGLSFFLMAAILSCRIPGLDRHFGGLSKLWQTHHKLGGIALILVLLHPILLALGRAEVSLASGVEILFPPPQYGYSIWLGWISLILMVVFLAPSFHFFGKPDYQRWKWIHRLAGISLLFALAHNILLARVFPQPVNALMWGSLTLAAIGALGYRFLFSPTRGSPAYTISEITPFAKNVVELTLQPKKSHLEYRTGQFIYLSPYDKTLKSGYAEEHPYTLSSAPEESALRVAIKDLGDASRAIQSVQPGTLVKVEGPYGRFFLSDDMSSPELWIAGGIGITPFLSRVRAIASDKETKVDIHLLFCVQDEERFIFEEELTGYAESIPGFVLTSHFFYREGPLSLQFISKRVPDFKDRTAYICGPPPLIELSEKILVQSGVSSGGIHTENFELL